MPRPWAEMAIGIAITAVGLLALALWIDEGLVLAIGSFAQFGFCG